MVQDHGSRAVDAGETRKESKVQKGLRSILFVCLFYRSETQRRNRKSKSEKKGKATTLFLSCLREAVVAGKQRGEESCSLSRPIKSSSSTLCCGDRRCHQL